MNKYKIGKYVINAETPVKAMKIAKVLDSTKCKDSDKLLQMAYKLAQMTSYFDRANTPRSRQLLSQEDETKKAELFNYGMQVLNQLNQEIDNMKKAGVNNDSPFAQTTKIADLLTEAGDGMYWIGDTKLQALGKKLKASANEYDGLAKKYGLHRRDSAIKDYALPYTVWVKKDGQWKIFCGAHTTNVDRDSFIQEGYEDVKVTEAGKNVVDSKIKDDNISEFKKEFAKWQDLYMNKKLITSNELQQKYYELKKKYGITDSAIKDSKYAILHPTRYEFLSVGGRSWVKEDSSMIQKFNSEKEAIEFANKNTSLNCRIVKFEDSAIKDAAYDRSTIEALVSDEKAAIDAYNVAIANLDGKISDLAIKVLQKIRDDEQKHVENLYSILTGNITEKNLKDSLN